MTRLLEVAAGLGAAWLLLTLVLFWQRPRGASVGEILLIVPETLRLLASLAKDGNLARGVRLRLGLLLVYLALPFDLIPDFIPVIGQLDDMIIAVLVLRSVVKLAGADVVAAHWRGSAMGLSTLWRVARLPGMPPFHPEREPGR